MFSLKTAREKKRGRSMYTNILLPTDGLGKCKFGTCHGILLAKNLGAKVTAVCVTEKLSGQDILKIYNPDMLFGDFRGKGRARVDEARGGSAQGFCGKGA